MNELVEKVEKWSSDKGLHESDPKSQFLKVAEEFGEIGAAMARNDEHELKDAIGDVIVTLIILAQQNGTDVRSEEHTSELQSRFDLVCRLLLEKNKKKIK